MIMNRILFILAAIILFSCTGTDKTKDKEYTALKKEKFEKTINGKKVSLYSLMNKNGVEAYFTNYGARVVSLYVPDKEGNFDDIVLGFDNIDTYLKEPMYLGCIVGRFANRINDAVFTLEGTEYHVSKNDGFNCLHGGEKGFDKRVWNVEQEGNKIIFSYLSTDGEQGFPGNLKVKKTYTLTDDNELKIEYEAETDQTTVINLSHHGYFNLKGEGDSTILDHYLMLNADHFTPVDNTLIPTGEIREVKGTPFDFTKNKMIGKDINSDDEQMKFGQGFDHNWVLNQKKEKEVVLAARLWEKKTGRVMEVYTDEPGIQFYSGNFMDGTFTGKSGKKYVYRAALALETQHFPDSPNHPEFPSTVLKPGEKYSQLCIYKFGIKE